MNSALNGYTLWYIISEKLKSSVTSLAPVLFVSFLFSVYKRLTSKTAYGRPTSKKHPQKEKKEKNTHTQTDNRSLTFPGFPNPHSSLESHLNSHGSSNSLLCCVCQVAATGPHLARIWPTPGYNRGPDPFQVCLCLGIGFVQWPSFLTHKHNHKSKCHCVKAYLKLHGLGEVTQWVPALFKG